jgi:hypothetical protein
MAGGINLPGVGIGVGPILSARELQPMAQDPFTTALKAWQTGAMTRAQETKNKAEKIALPYTERLIQSDLAYKLAQGNLFNEQAKYFGPSASAEAALNSARAGREQFLVDYLKNRLPGAQVGGVAGDSQTEVVGGANGMGSQSNAFADQFGDQYVRSVLNIPSEFPGEREQRDIRTFSQKENVRQGNISKYGTTQHQTENQRMKQAIENLTPIIEELATIEVPPQQIMGESALNPFNIIYADQQANYKATTAVATDKILSAFQLPKNEKSQHLVENITERRPWESLSNYRSRVKKELVNLKETYDNVIKNTGEATLRGPSVLVETRGSSSATYPLMQMTDEELDAAIAAQQRGM